MLEKYNVVKEKSMLGVRSSKLNIKYITVAHLRQKWT